MPYCIGDNYLLYGPGFGFRVWVLRVQDWLHSSYVVPDVKCRFTAFTIQAGISSKFGSVGFGASGPKALP